MYLQLTLYGFPLTSAERAERGIFPERVFGSCFTNTPFWKAATGPMSVRTCSTISSKIFFSSVFIPIEQFHIHYLFWDFCKSLVTLLSHVLVTSVSAISHLLSVHTAQMERVLLKDPPGSPQHSLPQRDGWEHTEGQKTKISWTNNDLTFQWKNSIGTDTKDRLISYILTAKNI